MSEHKESLVKVLEYIVNDEQEKAADLLHNVFVEKAKNHWASLQENDEIVEDEIADEDLDETIDLDEADDDSEDEKPAAKTKFYSGCAALGRALGPHATIL